MRVSVEGDQSYSLFGFFDVPTPLIYGKGEENVSKRLREEIDKAPKGEAFPAAGVHRRIHSGPGT